MNKRGVKQITKAKLFLYGNIVFIIGIAIASFLPIDKKQYEVWWFVGALVSWILAIMFWRKKEGDQVFGRLPLIFLLFIFLFLGFWRYAISVPAVAADKIWFYNSQRISFLGMISAEPDKRDKNVKYKIATKKFESGQKVSGNVLVTADLYPEYNYGDRLQINCELQKPEEFNDFAYDRYLARYDIYSVCYYPRIEFVGSDSGWRFYTLIISIKDKFTQKINQGLSEPYAALARAMTLGDKQGIPAKLRENFSQTGISHLVAISGLHISIISAMVMAGLLGIGIPRRKAFYGASFFLISYVLLVGAPASAMRAGLMAWLVLWAMQLGRLSRVTNSLVFAAALLLLINPRLLRDDIGFQLSFLATLGIIYGYPIINYGVKKISHGLIDKQKLIKGGIDILSVSLAAQIFTLPIIAYHFSTVSIIAPFTNLFVLWATPVVLALTMLGIGLGFLLPSLLHIIFLPAQLFYFYIIYISQLFSNIPFSYLSLEYIWPGWLIGYFIFLTTIIYLLSRHISRKQSLILF